MMTNFAALEKEQVVAGVLWGFMVLGFAHSPNAPWQLPATGESVETSIEGLVKGRFVRSQAVTAIDTVTDLSLTP